MKPKVLAGAGAICLIVVMWLIWRPQSFEDRFDEVMDDLTSYHLKGDMEITKGEEVKSYVLDVAYQASEKQDFFKVSLYDKALNQEQTIIRNQEGVFVVTPSLNQVFKFEGDWPLNTPKPYLLQSMAEIIKGKTAQIKEKKDGYLVSSPVTYPNNPTFHHEELFFHKEGDVKWIHIYDKDNTSQMKIVFHECEYNRKLKKDFFEVPKKLEKQVANHRVEEADLPLYPMQVFDAKLTNRNVVESGGIKRHVMEYQGEKSFTVIQTLHEAAEEMEVVRMSGEMIDSLDLIGVYDGTHMSVIDQGVEFSVFSDELSPMEMMRVISSMQVAVMK